MERWEKAVEKHKCGYNCAQAVACTFHDLVDLEERDVFRMAEGFGLGMGSNDVCGAVTAMLMIASAKNSDGATEAPKTKKATYEIMRELQNAFKEKNGSIYCRDLLGAPGKPKLRSCPGCIEDAAALLEEHCFSE